MFRSPPLMTSVCLLRTHRSLLMKLKDFHKLGRPICSSTFSKQSCVITSAGGQRWDKHHKHEPQSTTWNSQDLHKSLTCTADNSHSVHSTDSTQNLPNTTRSEHFTLRDSVPHKCLLLVNQPTKHKSLVDKQRSNLATTLTNKNSYHTMMGRTSFKGRSSRTHELTRKLWTPLLEGWTHHGILKGQTCGLHKRVPHQDSLAECLSPENEARCRRDLQPNAALYESKKEKSWAAVLVSLCTVGGEPSLLFTLRSSKLRGRHKGDVSFAGGKRDPSDRNVVDTALREAREELGITVPEKEVWGALKPMHDQSGMMIAPVIANLGPLEALTFSPNPSEVDEIFTLTVAHVCSPQNRGYTHFRVGGRYGYTVPVFHNSKYRVWGLTAVALDHTLKLIVPD